MNYRRNKARHMGSRVFLAVMLVTLPTAAFGTRNCFLHIEPDAGVLWLHGESTNHGTWEQAPQEIYDTAQLEAKWDAGLIGTESFSGDISYEIGNSETYINIHLTCNAITGDTGAVVWKYTKCSLSGNDPGGYTCERLAGTESFVVRAN